MSATSTYTATDGAGNEQMGSQYPDPRLVFRAGDACALDCTAGTFDRVLSLLMLHFVPQPELAIAEMRRVAKPGAVVAAAVRAAYLDGEPDGPRSYAVLAFAVKGVAA